MPDISVLHLSASDARGGAARSAYKIHDGLRRLGVNSKMLVGRKDSVDPDVDVIAKGAWRYLDAIGRYVFDPLGLHNLFYPSAFCLTRHPWYRQANIVQLYTVHGGFFTHLCLPGIGREKRIVWRFSDLWPATGHCAYPRDCDRWQTGCDDCPRPGDHPSMRIDTSAMMWRLKKHLYGRTDIQLVATNSWMREQIAHSALLNRFPVSVIPNGVDTALLQPIEKAAARTALAIPVEAKVVLFAAHVAALGTRKGGEFVISAMEQLAASGQDGLVLAVLGERAEYWPEAKGYRTVRLGSVNGDRFLAAAYSSADVLICPAMAENLPNTVLEAFACGTPAAAFDVGGIKDVIIHGETGFLAAPGDAPGLAEAVGAMLSDRECLSRMSARCRETATNGYGLELQASRFKKLYESLL